MGNRSYVHVLTCGSRISCLKVLSYLETHDVSPCTFLNVAFASLHGHFETRELFLHSQKLAVHAGLPQNQLLAQTQQMQVCSPNFSHLHHPDTASLGVKNYERL